MAIKKSIVTKQGVNAEYWTINSIHIFGNLTVRGKIYGYATQEAYNNGAEKLDEILFNITEFTKEDILSYANIYDFIMQNVEELVGGEVILEDGTTKTL